MSTILPVFQQPSMSQEEAIFVRPLSADSIAGYALLKDIYGKSSLVLRVDKLRSTYKQGRAFALAEEKKAAYGFAVSAYDPRYPLVIDPLLYSTYLGGSSNVQGCLDWPDGVPLG